MEYEQMRVLEKTHECSMCGGSLVTIWDSENDCYRVCCGKDPTHNGIRKIPTATELLKRGRFDEVAGTGAQKDIEAQAKRQPERFNLMPKTDAQTGNGLTLADIDGLICFADSVGLNAFLGHVELYFGKPRVSIDGYYYKAKTRGENVSVLAQPASAEEYKQYKVPETDYFYIARGWLGVLEMKEVGLGIVTQDEIAEMSKKNVEQKRSPIVAKYPQRMAEKRAEWQLLRKLIPLEVT